MYGASAAPIHYALMCRTTKFLIGDQHRLFNNNPHRQKSGKENLTKQKFNKYLKQRDAFREMSMANAYVNKIHCKMIEAEIFKNYREQAASKKAEVDSFRK